MKKGKQYIITTGEYSDYGIRDCFVAKRTFSFDNALKKWLLEYGDKDGAFGYGPGQGEQDFLAWLRAEGFVKDADINEVHNSQLAATPADDASDDEVPQGSRAVLK